LPGRIDAIKHNAGYGLFGAAEKLLRQFEAGRVAFAARWTSIRVIVDFLESARPAKGDVR